MAKLTQITERLLDRLFNLKGEDNIVLADIERKIDSVSESMRETVDEKTSNEASKVDCEGKLSVFEFQKDTFQSVFAGLDNNTFAALRDIDVNVEIGSMLEAIEQRAPEYSEGLRNEIHDYETAIQNNSDRIDELTEELKGLKEQEEKAIEDRNKLVSLIEQSLSPNEIERESLTASYVKKILVLFNVFTPEEVSQLTKLIIFSDEGLTEYAENYEERLSRGEISIGEPTEEYVEKAEEVADELEAAAKQELGSEEASETPEPEEEGLVVLDSDKQDEELTSSKSAELAVEMYKDGEEDSDGIGEDDEQQAFTDIDTEKTTILSLSDLNYAEGEEVPREEPAEETELPEQKAADEDEVVPEEPAENPLIPEVSEEEMKIKELSDYLNSIGINPLLFIAVNKMTTEEILEFLLDADRKTIATNYEMLRSLNIDEKEIYRNRHNHMYIADEEFSRKVTLLRAKSISEAVIKDLIENPESGLREPYIVVEGRINAIESIHRKVTDENIDLLAIDMVRSVENYNELIKNGYELEEKELRNFSRVLLDSKYVKGDVEILKNYLISIVRKNGKYALSVFWKSPSELLADIDDLIESDLEDVIASNPEVIAQSGEAVIRRVKYCEDKGCPIYDGENGSTVCDYIVDFTKFAEKFGDVENLPVVANHEDNNSLLAELIGNKDFVEILVRELDSYYRENEEIKEIVLDDETNDKFEELKRQIVEKLNAEPTGKYTYKIGDTCISKIKFERNLSILLNALANSGQSLEGVDMELILTAALYNTRQDEETLRKMVSECLGFNSEDTIGGKKI